MTHPLSIQAAHTDHQPDLVELCAALGYPVPAVQLARRLVHINSHPDHRLYLALIQARVVGWVHLVYTLRLTSDPYVEIAGLVVDSKYRCRGVGRRLIEQARLWAVDREACQLRVRCQEQRSEAHRFYQSTGFNAIKQQRVFSLPLTP